tara:strand:- start:1195 stop:1368 length:174 start_codon:yes stop_codon:yes gene_type:complete
MKQIIKWFREHLPKWLDLSHDEPWDGTDDGAPFKQDFLSDNDDQAAHHFGPPSKDYE